MCLLAFYFLFLDIQKSNSGDLELLYFVMCSRIRCYGVPLTFVAEQTSPVLLTGALPGLAAGPVNTAGIRQALVTEWTLPAVVTPATHSGEEDC